MKGIPTVAGFC